MEKWLSKIDDSKKLILMNIPGTHDSTAYYMNRISFNWARTQNLAISDQLKIGIRRLDVRIIQANNDISLDEDIICCHGICDCYLSPNFGDRRKLTYKSILLDVKKFLEENPTEFVLFGTYLGRGNNDNPIKRAFEIFDKYIGDMSIKYKTDLTLGEVRGKVVNYTILRDEYDNKNVLKRTISQTLVSGTGISGVHSKYQNCATFKTNGNIKVKEMKDMFELYKMTLEEAEIKDKIKELTFPITYSISCTGEYDYCLPNPLNQSIIVHSFIQKEKPFKKGYYYGWLNMDFANINTTNKLIESNFTEEEHIQKSSDDLLE